MKWTSAWKSLSSACAQSSRRYYYSSGSGGGGELALRGYVSDMVLRFRVALRTFWPKGRGGPAAREAVGYGSGRRGHPFLLSRCLQRWVKHSHAADLRRQAARQLFAGFRLPLMGLTGVCLVTKPSLVTSEEELESVCVSLRELAADLSAGRKLAEVPDKAELHLDDLELGAPLGKGCNAVIYRARWKNKGKDTGTPSAAAQSPGIDSRTVPSSGGDVPAPQNKQAATVDPPPALSIEKVSSEAEIIESIRNEAPAAATTVGPPPSKPIQEFSPLSAAAAEEEGKGGKEDPYDLAVKVMFNYDAASNAAAIWHSLRKECLPVLHNLLLPPGRWRCPLPPHAHVVEMPAAFADSVCLLPGATLLWPSALSPRLHPGGCGRNATLYLVMRRYECSLSEYLRSGLALEPRTRLSLLCQLLEAVCYLRQCGVAHRDLKADNLLLDLSRGVRSPRLVVSDFGSCLAEGSLQLPFPSEEINRGGNAALMPPEVSAAQPGPLSVLDYRRADVWVAATLAYELWGAPNPFYGHRMDSRTYAEQELPRPPQDMPPVVRALVRDMLRREPRKRPSAALAATVCQLLLLAPPDLLRGPNDPSDARRLLRWLCRLMAHSLPHWNHRGDHASGKRQSPPQDYTEAIHTDGTGSLPLPKPSISDAGCGSTKPCPVPLELARVLLSRVSLPQALEALRYIREHWEDGK
ncbi:PTEN-induced putative kinase 1 [Haemaphysalis longicornis]